MEGLNGYESYILFPLKMQKHYSVLIHSPVYRLHVTPKRTQKKHNFFLLTLLAVVMHSCGFCWWKPITSCMFMNIINSFQATKFPCSIYAISLIYAIICSSSLSFMLRETGVSTHECRFNVFLIVSLIVVFKTTSLS